MSECKHNWWCSPNERWKSNPEQISVICIRCNEHLRAKVAKDWKELEKIRKSYEIYRKSYET